MQWASVPEAAVDEYSQLSFREYDVDRPPSHERDGGVDPVAEASSMQFTSQCEFRGRIASSLSCEPSRRRRIPRGGPPNVASHGSQP